MLHTRHLEFLDKAKARGDFLYVGVYDDDTVSKLKGRNHPLLTLHERVLMVLSCKHVDDVIIGAPF